MLQAFIIVLREGFEAFLIVAIIFAYLKRSGKSLLLPAVRWGIAASILTSALLGFIFWQTSLSPFLEGIFGLFAALLVGTFVIHMWRSAPYLKRDMENHLNQATENKPAQAALWGVFLFTVFMVTREGMEMVLLLIQIHTPTIVTGILLGVLAAGAMSLLWVKFSRFINLGLFFQVTSIFLMFFVLQILIYSFHEFTEAGIFPASEALHRATEPFSPEGLYGRWFSAGMILFCAVWLVGAWLNDVIHKKVKTNGSL